MPAPFPILRNPGYVAMLSLLVLSGCGKPDEFKGRVTVMVSQPEAEAADAVAGVFAVDVDALCGEFTRAYPETGAEFRLSPAGASIEVEIAVVRPTSHQAEQDAKDAAERFVEMVDDARKEKATASLEALKAQIEKQRAKTELSRARMLEMLERSGHRIPDTDDPKELLDALTTLEQQLRGELDQATSRLDGLVEGRTEKSETAGDAPAGGAPAEKVSAEEPEEPGDGAAGE